MIYMMNLGINAMRILGVCLAVSVCVSVRDCLPLSCIPDKDLTGSAELQVCSSPTVCRSTMK